LLRRLAKSRRGPIGRLRPRDQGLRQLLLLPAQSATSIVLNLHVYWSDIDHYGERGQIIGFSFVCDHDLNGDVLARSEAFHLWQRRKRAREQGSQPMTLLPRFPRR